MSDTVQGLGYRHITAKWGWFVALGIVLVLVGLFALIDTVAFTIASVIFIGAMMAVGGIFQIVHAFVTKTWGSFFLNLLMGMLYTAGGFLIMDEPAEGSVIITLFLIVAMVMGGAMRIVIGLRHRELQGWWLLVLGGLVSVVVALMLYAMMPWSGLWVLGTLIAVELLFHGFTWIQFGLSLRRHGAAG